MEFLSLRELEGLARARLPAGAFDYVAGGGGDEITLRENEAAWRRWRLAPRALVDVSRRTTSSTVLGTPVAFPALVAPTAFHRLMHADGEAATARAAAEAGTLMIASTLSTTSLEDIAAASAGPKWFQLYVYKDRDLTRSLVDRAKAAGYSALVLTVDTATWGRRERDVRNRFTLPDGLTLANFADARRLLGAAAGDNLARYVAEQLDPSLTWRDVDWLREVSGMPVVVKGIVTAEDARLAVEHGCAGVVVSNHGGRQLDAGVATLDALPDVVEAVAEASARRGRDEGSSSAVSGRCEVYVDGGARRGTDVLVALALGARAVLVGRPVMWSLALGGQAGVARALGILRDEFDSAMALCGLTRPDDAGRGLLRRAP